MDKKIRYTLCKYLKLNMYCEITNEYCYCANGYDCFYDKKLDKKYDINRGDVKC